MTAEPCVDVMLRVDGAARRRLHDQEVGEHDPEQRRDDQEQAAGEVCEHYRRLPVFWGSTHQVSTPISYFGETAGRPKRSQ